MSGKNYFIYILASKKNGTLYTGVTNDLERRVAEHRNGAVPGFPTKHKVFKLVYFETLDAPGHAIAREKQLKAGSRADKIRLIERDNPEWGNLFDGL